MFDKILIANRGEIACRIIETAHQMGVRTVAVYSEADRSAKHVSMADEAWLLGPAPASESYLVADKIIDIALKSGAKAIHPGYGFLSENAAFAQTCADNGLVFIGPPVKAIEAMGSKSAAKEIMSAAEVPLVPGYHGEDQSTENLLQASLTIGFPVLLKATAGGGGKGMRIVDNEEQFSDALASCKREAMASFSDDEVLVEKYLTQPRHIEVQIFADNFGNVIHLFDRDCSVQRRHQKVIEEAPAPGLSDETRKAMSDVAITAAKAIDYSGAGTIEFLYDKDGSFYFMEMNTRLQVEHPVTEMVTGIDLVEWQLNVANNQPLPKTQKQIKCQGHAFEVRIYAEDAEQDFLPATGTIVHLSTPNVSNHVRIDTGILEGDEVSIYYDPMIAKLVVWERDRATSLARLRGALADYQIVGTTTNLNFLSALASHPEFNNEHFDTSFIEQHRTGLSKTKSLVNNSTLSLAALYLMLKEIIETKERSTSSADPYSPWNQVSGWSNNIKTTHQLKFIDPNADEESDESIIEVSVQFNESTLNNRQFTLIINNQPLSISGSLCGNQLSANLSGQHFSAKVIEYNQQLHILTHGRSEVLGLIAQDHTIDTTSANGSLKAPMPGTIIAVHVNQDDEVEEAQPLITLEAMKMEHTIVAHSRGTISEIFFAEGDLVSDGAELLAIEPCPLQSTVDL